MLDRALAAPIVLLHGVGLDRRMWGETSTLLEAMGYRVVALDLPGHGSRPPLRSRTSLGELAADIEARLPDGECHLVGFSLGALIGQQLAVSSPRRVRTLGCVSSVCQRTDEESAAVLGRLATAQNDFPATVERSIERWYEGTSVSAGLVAETRRTLESSDVESFVHAYEVFATGDRAIAPFLSGIRQRTLAITGELDPGSTPEMTERLAACIPGAKARVLPGVRHMLPVQAPHELAREIDHLIIDAEGASSD